MKEIIIIDSNGNFGVLSNSFLLTIAIIVGCIVLLFYLLRSFALYKMCINQQEPNPGLCFVPLLWIYKAAKISGTATFFGKKIKKFPLIVCLIFSISSIIAFAHTFTVYLPIVGYYLSGGQVYYNFSEIGEFSGMVAYWTGPTFFVGEDMVYPFTNIFGVMNVLNIVSYFSRVITLISDVALITFYFAFFKSRNPMRTFAFSILSIFGFFPILAFIVRNCPYIDYDEYIRSRYQRMYANRNMGNGYNNNNNYNNYNNYNNNYNNQNNQSSGDPFDGYNTNGNTDNSSNENPFSEFPDNNDNNKN